jgi:hypothetical protein
MHTYTCTHEHTQSHTASHVLVTLTFHNLEQGLAKHVNIVVQPVQLLLRRRLQPPNFSLKPDVDVRRGA